MLGICEPAEGVPDLLGVSGLPGVDGRCDSITMSDEAVNDEGMDRYQNTRSWEGLSRVGYSRLSVRAMTRTRSYEGTEDGGVNSTPA